jgi:hypothetical protein
MREAGIVEDAKVLSDLEDIASRTAKAIDAFDNLRVPVGESVLRPNADTDVGRVHRGILNRTGYAFNNGKIHVAEAKRLTGRRWNTWKRTLSGS